MPSSLIRLAGAQDAAEVQAIYAPFVCDTPISFEIEPPSVAKIKTRITTTLQRFPWLVCERQDDVMGYVYAGPHHARAAYAWSVDVAVYIHPLAHRAGVGRALYSSLFEILRLQGFTNAFAGVTLPNAGSVGLHESLGFEPIGIHRKVGFKSGAWHDVGWWQLVLQEYSPAPVPPLSLPEVQGCAGWTAALEAGLPFLKL